jgi:hypothetical protein
MNAFLANYQKGIYCGFLLLLLGAMDLLKINDAALKYTAISLIGSISGVGGIVAMVQSYKGNTQTPQQ